MSKINLQTKIHNFRQLHKNGKLLLANSWDAMSARLAEQVGATAIATTSAGMSWSLGYPDGHRAERKQIMHILTPIIAATNLPVTIDIEDGLLSTGENMSHLVEDLFASGCAGINIEDTKDGQILPIEQAVTRINEVRQAALKLDYPLFINARMDAVLFGINCDSRYLIDRANTLFAAGADCIFIPGLIALQTIREVSKEINGPLNVMALPGAPSANEIFAAGATRLSGGSFFAEQAYGLSFMQMQKFLESGQLQEAKEAKLEYMDLNSLIAR